MNLLIFILLLAAGVCEALFWQRLSCPHEPKHKSLLRVWCRQTSAECCTGFTFSQDTQMLDGGKLRVTQDSHFFTVEVMEPAHRGVYWCGVLSRNDTIIKLAEGYLYSSSGAFIWNFARWILLPLLPVVTLLTYVCLSRKRRFRFKDELCSQTVTSGRIPEPMQWFPGENQKAEELYDDVAASRVQTDLQSNGAASSTETES